jgi:hypothetical protein
MVDDDSKIVLNGDSWKGFFKEIAKTVEEFEMVNKDVWARLLYNGKGYLGFGYGMPFVERVVINSETQLPNHCKVLDPALTKIEIDKGFSLSRPQQTDPDANSTGFTSDKKEADPF